VVDAITLVTTIHVDGLVADLTVPGLDGRLLARRVRDRLRSPSLPAIGLGGDAAAHPDYLVVEGDGAEWVRLLLG
jgi:CheY-like chemotaxis protein